ncbi:MAG: hypothetical protein LBN97_00595, partial [Oscillospiraceae bacterium]|nr:hypothetical protein [Oscillospiraceae bacterium]
MSKKLLALALTLAMILSLGTGAFAAGEGVAADGHDIDGSSSSGTMQGNGDVYIPPIKLTVPTNLNFALSPYGGGAIAGNQIQSTSYQFVNKSDIPVQVRFDISVLTASDVTLATASADVKGVDDNEVKAKVIQFGILGAKSLANLDDAEEGFDSYATGTV